MLYRESKVTKQILISVIVSPAGDDVPLDKIKERVKQTFENLVLNGLSVVSVSMITSEEVSGGFNQSDKLEVLAGE